MPLSPLALTTTSACLHGLENNGMSSFSCSHLKLKKERKGGEGASLSITLQMTGLFIIKLRGCVILY